MDIFSFFRPVLYFLIAILIISLVIVSFQKKETKLMNGFSLSSIICICVGTAAISLYMTGIGADELGLGGDPRSFDLSIITVILSAMNFIVYGWRNRTK